MWYALLIGVGKPSGEMRETRPEDGSEQVRIVRQRFPDPGSHIDSRANVFESVYGKPESQGNHYTEVA